MKQEIGERIKKLRKDKGITQERLAIDICISRSNIGRYERNEIEPDIASLESLADYFGVSIDYLVRGETKMSDKNEINDCLNKFFSSASPKQIHFANKLITDNLAAIMKWL